MKILVEQDLWVLVPDRVGKNFKFTRVLEQEVVFNETLKTYRQWHGSEFDTLALSERLVKMPVAG